jgi:hypothetical protein
MRRYKLAVHILVILSVFNFVPVFAAPVAVQAMREACADVAEGGDDVIIVSGKRAEEGQDPLTQASPGQSTSVQLPTPGSQSTSGYANGVHQETTNPIQQPSSASGDIRRPPYASSQTELPWYSSGDTGPHLLTPDRGGVQQVQPGTTSKPLPSWSVRTKTQPPSSASGDVQRPPYALGSPGGTEPPWYSSDDTRPHLLTPGRGGVQQVQPGTTSKPLPSWSVRTKTQPPSSASGDVQRPPYALGSPGGTELPWYSSDDTGPHLLTPGRGGVATTEIGPATPSPSESPGETPPASPSKVPPGSPEWGTSGEEKYPAQVQENQPKPVPKTVWGKLASKSKSVFRKMGKVFKGLVSEMVDNPHLQLRFSATASGAVNAAQSELQGKVTLKRTFLPLF